jgi:hypothetical protein
MRHRASAGRVKVVGRRFVLAPSECETEEEENPGGPVLGRKAVVTWAGVGISKEKSGWAAMAIGPN